MYVCGIDVRTQTAFKTRAAAARACTRQEFSPSDRQIVESISEQTSIKFILKESTCHTYKNRQTVCKVNVCTSNIWMYITIQHYAARFSVKHYSNTLPKHYSKDYSTLFKKWMTMQWKTIPKVKDYSTLLKKWNTFQHYSKSETLFKKWNAIRHFPKSETLFNTNQKVKDYSTPFKKRNTIQKVKDYSVKDYSRLAPPQHGPACRIFALHR